MRLAGIYAIARQRQQCVDVLCAYLRLPHYPDNPEAAGEREVRLTVIRLLTEHLQISASKSWRGHKLDFTGALFDGGVGGHGSLPSDGQLISLLAVMKSPH